MLGVSISLGAISASAQQPQTMEDAVARISEAISHSKMKRVVVFDFVGPGDYVTQLGGDLAEEFSSMLAGRAPKLKLDPPPQTRALLTKKGYSQPALFDSDSAVNFARSIKQQGMIWGTLSSEPGGIKLVLSLHKPDPKWTAIESAEVLLPSSDQQEALLNQIIAMQRGAFPFGGRNGYSQPICVHCPSPRFTADAVRHHTEGKVVLNVLVGVHGEIESVVVIQRLPNGLTERAIQTVRDWTFQPATGPDGKPAVVQSVVQVQFRLYH